MREATFSLAEANFAAGDFRYKPTSLIIAICQIIYFKPNLSQRFLIFCVCSQMVLQNVDKAEIKLKFKKDNVAGVCVIVRFGGAVTALCYVCVGVFF